MYVSWTTLVAVLVWDLIFPFRAPWLLLLLLLFLVYSSERSFHPLVEVEAEERHLQNKHKLFSSFLLLLLSPCLPCLFTLLTASFFPLLLLLSSLSSLPPPLTLLLSSIYFSFLPDGGGGGGAGGGEVTSLDDTGDSCGADAFCGEGDRIG